MKTGGGVYKGEPKQGKADCTLSIDDKNMVDMASGKLNGQTVRFRSHCPDWQLTDGHFPNSFYYLLFGMGYLYMLCVVKVTTCFF